jgi:hypothetical protein
MRPSFCRVWKEIGVAKWTWETRPVLMIPMQRPSLVLVRDAAGQPLRSDPGLVTTRINKDGVTAALDKYLTGIGVTGDHRKELAGALWTAIIQELEAGGVLLSVKAKAGGASWLKAGDVKQTVFVTRPLVADVTFKFLHHLDEDGVMIPATRKDPWQVDDWISDLNWILGAQANIWFEVEQAEPLKINRVMGQTLGDEAFKNYIAKEKDSDADVTVFLVGKWKGTGDAGATFYPNLNVIALSDKPPIPVVEGDDPFTIGLAHELVHYALHYRGYKQVFHVKDQYSLLNHLVESTVITPELQRMLSA